MSRWSKVTGFGVSNSSHWSAGVENPVLHAVVGSPSKADDPRAATSPGRWNDARTVMPPCVASGMPSTESSTSSGASVAIRARAARTERAGVGHAELADQRDLVLREAQRDHVGAGADHREDERVAVGARAHGVDEIGRHADDLVDVDVRRPGRVVVQADLGEAHVVAEGVVEVVADVGVGDGQLDAVERVRRERDRLPLAGAGRVAEVDGHGVLAVERERELGDVAVLLADQRLHQVDLRRGDRVSRGRGEAGRRARARTSRCPSWCRGHRRTRVRAQLGEVRVVTAVARRRHLRAGRADDGLRRRPSRPGTPRGAGRLRPS